MFGDFAAQSIAVMAFLLHGRHAQLRGKAAVVIATAIFAYGGAGGHIYQMIANRDYAANNTGLLLFMDLFIPTVGLALVIWHTAVNRHTADLTDAPTREDNTLTTTGR